MAGQPSVSTPTPQLDSPAFGGRMAALAALLVLLGLTLVQISRIGGLDEKAITRFAYTQDSAYEHLVIGREWLGSGPTAPAPYGGATPLAASASPGWSVLMALLLELPTLSPDEGRSLDEIALVPLVVNLAAAALLILVAGHLVRRDIRSGRWMFAFLLGLGLFLPLAPLVLTGMEHLTHMVVLLLLVAVGLQSLEGDDFPVLWTVLGVVLAGLAVSLRYESLAVLLALVVWGWVQRRTIRPLFMLLAGIVIVVWVGVHLSRQGGGMVSNPVLVHAASIWQVGWQDWPSRLVQHALQNLAVAPLPWMLLGMGVVLLAAWRGRVHASDDLDRQRVGWLFIFVFAALAHLLVGKVDGGEHRYTAYLIALGAVAIARPVAATFNRDILGQARPVAPAAPLTTERTALIGPVSRPWYRGSGVIAILCILPLVVVGLPAVERFASAADEARAAYVRNREAAAFVRIYHTDGIVATNQTGAVGYETRARLVDISGSTNPDLARARLEGQYDADRVAAEVSEAGASVALVMGRAADVPVPQDWVAIGGWYRSGEDRVSPSAVRIYSVSPAMESDARISLRLFSERRGEGIDFWFVEDDGSPVTQPGALQWSAVAPAGLSAATVQAAPLAACLPVKRVRCATGGLSASETGTLCHWRLARQ